MKAQFFSSILVLPLLIFSGSANAGESICHDFSSNIEPDMQRQETDFTHENFVAAQENVQTIRGWMEDKFERYKNNPTADIELFDGEIWLAQANYDALVKGYVLKLEYLSASPDRKEKARQAFCKFVTETPYYD